MTELREIGQTSTKKTLNDMEDSTKSPMSILYCLSWIPSVLQECVRGFFFWGTHSQAFLTCSLVPGEQVLKCQTVCQRWKHLTRNFIDLHLKPASPRMLAQFVPCSNDKSK